jgi:hypothetical protein
MLSYKHFDGLLSCQTSHKILREFVYFFFISFEIIILFLQAVYQFLQLINYMASWLYVYKLVQHRMGRHNKVVEDIQFII